ncbi:hypothetical protein [Vulcanisaeta moutnovskia]|uniref:hypothetical protein n=1 Tax=Vulcanisaeta moutnovskia TaxID=985052 RepID=UPI001ED8D5CA|nr:hypothetical protein [Vulcanisaeta moutnovskia]
MPQDSVVLVTRLSVKGFYGINTSIDLGPLTIITGPPGSGKSIIIELLWRIFRGIRDRVFLEDLSRIGDARVEVTMALDDRTKKRLEEVGYSGDSVTISVGFDEGYVSVVKINDKEVLVAEFKSGVSRVKYPLDVEVMDASVLLNPDGLSPKEQALQLVGSASEDYEAALSVIKVLRDYLSTIGAYRMGPYIDFKGRVKNVDASYTDFIGEHGEHIVETLSQLFTDPRRDSDIRFLRKVLGDLGIRNFRAGWYNGELVLSYIDRRGITHIGDELPCHVKTILALITQLIVARRPSLILFENADYCLSEGLGNVITRLLSNYIDGRQLVMEARNKWFIDELRMPHVVLYNMD